jgi:hypothetical protein
MGRTCLPGSITVTVTAMCSWMSHSAHVFFGIILFFGLLWAGLGLTRSVPYCHVQGSFNDILATLSCIFNGSCSAVQVHSCFVRIQHNTNIVFLFWTYSTCYISNNTDILLCYNKPEPWLLWRILTCGHLHGRCVCTRTAPNNKLLKRSWDDGSPDVTRWSHHKSPD